MIKTLTKVGNSHGIIFDTTLMDMARLKPGEQFNVEVHKGGTITLTPVKVKPSAEEVSNAIQETMKKYTQTMKRLA